MAFEPFDEEEYRKAAAELGIEVDDETGGSSITFLGPKGVEAFKKQLEQAEPPAPGKP